MRRSNKIYTHHCEWCHFTTDDINCIKDHCLKFHGVTGKFGKGYKTTVKYRKKEEKLGCAI